MHNNSSNKCITVVGATATGKSKLALDMAECLDGEILCADSRTVYTGMDIGTAKPTLADRQRIRHWGLDLVTPDEPFSVSEFQRYAYEAIADINSRQKVPIMVGGSGLYIDAVLYNYQFRNQPDLRLRDSLNMLSVTDLQERIVALGLPMPADAHNPRRLMRIIESGAAAEATDRMKGIRPGALVLGIDLPMEMLEHRISARVDTMVEARLIEEIAALATTYGWEAQALQAPGYRAFRRYMNGDISLADAKALFVKNDRALAKRQKTWFKRNKSIQWLSTEDKLSEAVDIATTFLHT